MKMTRMMYCTAVRRIEDTFSSRPNISSQFSVPSRSLLEPIQRKEQKYSYERVHQRGPQLVRPAPLYVQIHQAARHQEVDDLVQNAKSQCDQQAGAGILDVELHAQR